LLFNYAQFSACIDTEFEVQVSSAERLTMELIRVQERHDSPRLEQFSLVFRGPMSPIQEQRIYPIKHERLGSFELFLVPIGPDEKGMCYEVVVNRLRPTSATQS
jgi:hypothetical protein